jgi:hypothetical protein
MQFEKMQRACAGVSSADRSITWILILGTAFVKKPRFGKRMNKGFFAQDYTGPPIPQAGI